MVLKSIVAAFFLLLLTSFLPFGILPESQRVRPDDENARVVSKIDELYQSLQEISLNSEAFRYALLGFVSLKAEGLVKQDSLLSIIDYSLPSSVERLFVIDLKNKKIRCRSLVAHGRNSGEECSTRFSNSPQSHKSSLGFYITGSTYRGAHGYSLLLNGIDTGYNDRARSRAIVMHGAGYVSGDYIERYGRLGRSLGCPALPPKSNTGIIDLIKEGTVLFCYYPDPEYLIHSTILGTLDVSMEILPELF
jgi:hypothetical protein